MLLLAVGAAGLNGIREEEPVRTMKDFPYKFPSEADKVYDEAREFRQASDTERFSRIFSLSESGRLLMAHSPKRDYATRWREQEEEEWRRIQRELFARYGD